MCRKTSNHDSSFYCLNRLHSFRTENKLKSNEKGCKAKAFAVSKCHQKNKILKLNYQTKSGKMCYLIYANIKCLVTKINNCENNPKISSLAKIGEHILCWYLLSTIWGFYHIENKHSLYHEIILQVFKRTCNKNNQFREEKNVVFDTEGIKSYKEASKCYICGIRFFKRSSNTINYRKVRYHC